MGATFDPLRDTLRGLRCFRDTLRDFWVLGKINEGNGNDGIMGATFDPLRDTLRDLRYLREPRLRELRLRELRLDFFFPEVDFFALYLGSILLIERTRLESISFWAIFNN